LFPHVSSSVTFSFPKSTRNLRAAEGHKEQLEEGQQDRSKLQGVHLQHGLVDHRRVYHLVGGGFMRNFFPRRVPHPFFAHVVNLAENSQKVHRFKQMVHFHQQEVPRFYWPISMHYYSCGDEDAF
jgi:hypothetical protein